MKRKLLSLLLALALVCSLLYSQAKVTELGAAIDSQSSVLDDFEKLLVSLIR